MSPSKTIILGVTGSIAAYKSAEIIRRLREEGFRVAVIMTSTAQHFITPLTLASLSGEKVYTDMFADVSSWEISHVKLLDKGDLLLIAPATANILGKIANGIADDLLTCFAMATKKPILIAPAMNDNMYNNIIVKENIAKLKKLRMRFIGPVKGKLASGTEGIGHLAEVNDIVKAVKKAVK